MVGSLHQQCDFRVYLCVYYIRFNTCLRVYYMQYIVLWCTLWNTFS